MSVITVQQEIQAMLETNNTCILSTSTYCVWSEVVKYHMVNQTMYCIIKEPRTLKNLQKTPRISFLCQGGNGMVQSCGLATLVKEIPVCLKEVEGTVYRIQSYYYKLTKQNISYVLEKHKENWELLAQDCLPQLQPQNWRQRFALWYKASRAVSFPFAFYPVIIGSFLALLEGYFHIGAFVLALLGGIAALAGVNFMSDYYDFKKGVDTPDALSSHTGILINEQIEPDNILLAGLACFVILGICGGLLVMQKGLLVLGIGMVGILGGYCYTGGKFAYKYRGYSEFYITFLMGPLMVLGSYFVQTGHFSWLAFLLSLSIGILVSSVTLANNLRDMSYDKKVNVTSLPIKLGIAKAKNLYIGMLVFPYLLVLSIIVLYPQYFPFAMVIFSLPLAQKAFQGMKLTPNTEHDFQKNASKFLYPLRSIRLHSRFCFYLLMGTFMIYMLNM